MKMYFLSVLVIASVLLLVNYIINKREFEIYYCDMDYTFIRYTDSTYCVPNDFFFVNIPHVVVDGLTKDEAWMPVLLDSVLRLDDGFYTVSEYTVFSKEDSILGSVKHSTLQYMFRGEYKNNTKVGEWEVVSDAKTISRYISYDKFGRFDSVKVFYERMDDYDLNKYLEKIHQYIAKDDMNYEKTYYPNGQLASSYQTVYYHHDYDGNLTDSLKGNYHLGELSFFRLLKFR